MADLELAARARDGLLGRAGHKPGPAPVPPDLAGLNALRRELIRPG